MIDGARARSRKISAATVATGHLGIVILALSGRLTFAVPSEFQLLAAVSENPAWVFIHGLCAVILLVSIARDKAHITALSFSSGWMGTWGGLNLLGGMTSSSPVSLAGPVLAIALAGTAYSVAMGWAVAPHRGSSK